MKHVSAGKVVPCAVTGRPKWEVMHCGYCARVGQPGSGKPCPVCHQEASRKTANTAR